MNVSELEDLLEPPNNLRVSAHYMHDCHLFSKLIGNTPNEIYKMAEEIRESDPYGMLCSIIVLDGDRELRRVGPNVHCRGDGFDMTSLVKWLSECENDQDIPKLLKKVAKNETKKNATLSANNV